MAEHLHKKIETVWFTLKYLYHPVLRRQWPGLCSPRHGSLLSQATKGTEIVLSPAAAGSLL